jgi:hypothetical protein
MAVCNGDGDVGITGLARLAAKLLLMGALAGTRTTPPADGPVYEGIAAHYDPGLMERVSRNRHMPIVGCMFASPIWKMGSWWRITGVKTGKSRICRATDTSMPKDRARHIRTHLIELNFNAAREICGSTRLANRECPVRIVKAEAP